MKRLLLVSNGHGEAAIADRIALEVRALARAVQLDHLALVGDGLSEAMHDVGPRRVMPSGGLIAMGSVRNIARDVAAGLLALTWAQYRFLLSARGVYDAAISVGDVYALWMTLAMRAPAVFVGTAKSVNVAPYGPFEERLLRRAALCFVRDDATVRHLHAHGVTAEAANVIVDLSSEQDDRGIQTAVHGFEPALALLPGSRESAYDDARFLLDVVREAGEAPDTLGAVLSIARGLDAQRFAAVARRSGWEVRPRDDASIPFALALAGREMVRAWRGPLGPLLARAALVLGQAGTANETAAAAGVPVVAFERGRDRNTVWYRRRQRGLLGDAIAVLPGDLASAAAGVRSLLADPARRARMGGTGRERMGPPGGARRIAERVVTLEGRRP